MKMNLGTNMKAKLKELKTEILKQMEEEQNLQTELRKTIINESDNDEVVEKAKKQLEESTKRWETLKKAMDEYNSLSAKKTKLSPDTVLVVAGNLLGIVLILYFERFDIIRSKALGFVLKGRV